MDLIRTCWAPGWSLVLGMLAMAAAPAFGQQSRIVLFQEEQGLLGSATYRNASSGSTTDGDVLQLAGPDGNKLPTHPEHAYVGDLSWLLAYRHQKGGAWTATIQRLGSSSAGLSAMDSLVLRINGPAGVPASELPRLALVDHNGSVSARAALKNYMPALDADTATWQRVSVPLSVFQPTADSFQRSETRAVRFTNGERPNETTRVLWVDHVVATGTEGGPPAPANLVSRAGDRSVVLHWEADDGDDTGRYRVYRARSPDGRFERRTSTLLARHFTDFEVRNDQSYRYRVRAVNESGVEGAPSEAREADPAVLSNAAFLSLVQQTAFDYFWREANPENGLVRDRSRENAAASIAATGFGLSAITIAINRGWITRAEGRERVLTTLETFWSQSQGAEASGTIGYKGFFYHFLDLETATRAGRSELSTIDTALLLGGILHAGAYFSKDQDAEGRIRALADSIYQRVDWTWAQARPPLISHGWSPEEGFLPYDWGGYNEAMIVYLLALGSPTHAVPPHAWEAWTNGYDWRTLYGYSFVVFPPLFGHQYSHLWFDFRGRQDAYMRRRGITYFENSRRATLANRAYAIDNPEGWEAYGSNTWGLTASDDPFGYRAHGAPPGQNDNGTITPTAAGGSMAFTPEQSLAALRHMYETYRTDLWGPYGFRDAFNPTEDWFASDYLGIDQGPIAIMIENHRSGSVWATFMQSEYVQRGLERAGFRETVEADERPAQPGPLRIENNIPNPFTRRTTIRYTLPRAGRAQLAVYDLLGRRVAILVNRQQRAGTHSARFEATSHPAGIYMCVLRSGDTAVRDLMTLVR